jgi:hydrogenase expression/formation protein HypE
MAQTAHEAGIAIVTGDTKVVQRGAADKIFINTAGIGVIPADVRWAASHIQAGDKVIVSGTLGDHGATILNLREQLGMTLEVESDCAVLAPMIAPLRALSGVRALRDATRGGVNAILHEFSAASGFGMCIDETAIPVKPAVRGICELLGLEPLNFANEGKLVVVVSAQEENAVLKLLRSHPLGADAATIGEVTENPRVCLRGALGVSRQLMLPHAEPLPRIC